MYNICVCIYNSIFLLNPCLPINRCAKKYLLPNEKTTNMHTLLVSKQAKKEKQ